MGTEVPSYRLDYKLTPQNDGKVRLTGSLTQSGVSDNFKMPVSLYLEFDNGIVRLGQATMTGSSTLPELEVILPRMPKRVMVNAMHDVLAVENISQQIK